MLFRLIIAWLCNFIDTIATVHLYCNFNGEELNPISDWLLCQSPTIFAVFKLVVMTIAVLAIWWKREYMIWNVASWVLFVEYLVVVIYYMVLLFLYL